MIPHNFLKRCLLFFRARFPSRSNTIDFLIFLTLFFSGFIRLFIFFQNRIFWGTSTPTIDNRFNIYNINDIDSYIANFIRGHAISKHIIGKAVVYHFRFDT
jgi:hypothetical protein